MKIKKTLSNWLTNRFLLIIRNEENFAEKRTFSFNYAKLIVFSITFLIIVFALSFYLINTILYRFNPEYSEIETNNRISELRSRVDSLFVEVNRKDIFIGDLKRILSGQAIIPHDTIGYTAKNQVKKEIADDSISEVELKFRKEMEDQQSSLQNLNISYHHKQEQNYFVKPALGVIVEKFDVKNKNFGVDIVTKSVETVKSIGDGMVIFSNYGDEGFIIAIQHKNGLISVYKYNSMLLKHSGEYVHAGDPIAMTGNTNDPGKRYKVHFQLWQEGNPVNPEHFVSF